MTPSARNRTYEPHSSPRRHPQGRLRPLLRRLPARNGAVPGPHFAGWEIYHLKGSPVDPDRIYCSQSSGWFGQIIQRSDDGGKYVASARDADRPADDHAGWPAHRREQQVRVRRSPETGRPLTTHQWYDGTQHPWEFKRVWHLEPSLTDPAVVYAGVEDAAPLPLDRRRPKLARAGVTPFCPRREMDPRRGRFGPAHDPARPHQRQPHVRRHLCRRRLSHRRRRPIVEADQPRPAFAVHPRPRSRDRPLRPPHRDAPGAARRRVHAEALGCAADRQ